MSAQPCVAAQPPSDGSGHATDSQEAGIMRRPSSAQLQRVLRAWTCRVAVLRHAPHSRSKRERSGSAAAHCSTRSAELRRNSTSVSTKNGGVVSESVTISPAWNLSSKPARTDGRRSGGTGGGPNGRKEGASVRVDRRLGAYLPEHVEHALEDRVGHVEYCEAARIADLCAAVRSSRRATRIVA